MVSFVTGFKFNSKTQETSRQQMFHHRRFSTRVLRKYQSSIRKVSMNVPFQLVKELLKTSACFYTFGQKGKIHLSILPWEWRDTWVRHPMSPRFERGRKSIPALLLTIKCALKFYSVFMMWGACVIYVDSVSHSLSNCCCSPGPWPPCDLSTPAAARSLRSPGPNTEQAASTHHHRSTHTVKRTETDSLKRTP